MNKNIKRCSIFIKRLHKLISQEDKKLCKSVIWDNFGDKNGFIIINLKDFHEKCITNKITNSINLKSLFRQLNNYGFKYADGFCYHPSGYFIKNSQSLKKIRYKDHIKNERIKKKESEKLYLKKNNNDILLMTEKFLCDEMFKQLEFPLFEDDITALFD